MIGLGGITLKFSDWAGSHPRVFFGLLAALMVWLAVFAVPAGWERDRRECEALNPGAEYTQLTRQGICLYADGTYRDTAVSHYEAAKKRRHEMYGVDW